MARFMQLPHKGVNMITVKITYKDGTNDIKVVLDITDICLDNVLEIKVLRQEKAA